MSDIHEEPSDDEITYPDAREAEGNLHGLVEENEGDFQEAVDDQLDGKEAEDSGPNPGIV